MSTKMYYNNSSLSSISFLKMFLEIIVEELNEFYFIYFLFAKINENTSFYKVQNTQASVGIARLV